MKYFELSKEIQHLLKKDVQFKKEFYKKNMQEHFGNFENSESIVNIENFYNDYKARKFYTNKDFFSKSDLEPDFFKNAIKFNNNNKEKYLTKRNIQTLCKILEKNYKDSPALYFLDKDFNVFIENFKLLFPYFFEKYILNYIVKDMLVDFLCDRRILVDIDNINTFTDLFLIDCYYDYMNKNFYNMGDIFDDGISTFFIVLMGYTNNKTIHGYNDGIGLVNKISKSFFEYFSNRSFKKAKKLIINNAYYTLFKGQYKKNKKDYMQFKFHFENLFLKKHSLKAAQILCADTGMLTEEDMKLSKDEIMNDLFFFADSIYLILKENDGYTAYYHDDEITKGRMIIYDQYNELKDAIDDLLL